MERSPTEWGVHYAESRRTGEELGWPSETLIRLIKGDYIPFKPKSLVGLSVIDVGFGNCNNTLFLAQMGLRVAGTEVEESICGAGREKMRQFGFSADFRVGTNRALPFDTDTFDLLVSWNVLHYEGDEAKIRATVKEYSRVLKRGGIALISTTAPDHKILTDAEKLDGHRYRINFAGDFRKGSVHFLMGTAEYARRCFGADFGKVLIGRTHDDMLSAILDWWIIAAQKS